MKCYTGGGIPREKADGREGGGVTGERSARRDHLQHGDRQKNHTQAGRSQIEQDVNARLSLPPPRYYITCLGRKSSGQRKAGVLLLSHQESGRGAERKRFGSEETATISQELNNKPQLVRKLHETTGIPSPPPRKTCPFVTGWETPHPSLPRPLSPNDDFPCNVQTQRLVPLPRSRQWCLRRPQTCETIKCRTVQAQTLAWQKPRIKRTKKKMLRSLLVTQCRGSENSTRTPMRSGGEIGNSHNATLYLLKKGVLCTCCRTVQEIGYIGNGETIRSDSRHS